MAWNTPGKGDNRDSSSGGGRDPWKRGGGRGGNDLLAKLRGFFDGGGGAGNPLRWLPVVVALWLSFSCFVLVTEQERGVVLRFGAFSRIMSPGPGFKLPWPIETVEKVNATQIKTLSNTVPVLTSDENIVDVEFNVQYRISDARQALFGTRDAETVLNEATLSSVREQVARRWTPCWARAKRWPWPRARGCRSRSTPTVPAWSSPNSTCPTRVRRMK
jgi:modulator of FtsH protease HflK